MTDTLFVIGIIAVLVAVLWIDTHFPGRKKH